MIVFLAILAGVSIVVSRFLNAGSADKNGLSVSTLMNYLTGLAVSLIVLTLARESGGFQPKAHDTFNPLIYSGGLVGVVTVFLSSYLARRLPAFLMTLLIFIAQLLTALALDYLLTGQFSLMKLLGGLLVLGGLWHYQWIHKRYEATPNALDE